MSEEGENGEEEEDGCGREIHCFGYFVQSKICIEYGGDTMTC